MALQSRRILLIGFGSIGQALVPLLRARFGITPLRAIAADDTGAAVAQQLGVVLETCPITPANVAGVLHARLAPGDLLVNVSVGVSSLALLAWCRDHGVLYLDTCIEPWAGGYAAADAGTSNYALRSAALALQRAGAPTALVAHGANPGLVSHFVKAGLEELARHVGLCGPHELSERQLPAWAALARELDIRVVHIAERDTQIANLPDDPQAFANTWSVEGLLAEAWQCAELGWGSHEPALPARGRRHATGDGSGIWIDTHSAAIRVASWVPSVGEQCATLFTHHEALSIAALLTIPGDSPARPAYRPTVGYAYRPCPAAAAGLARWQAAQHAPPRHRRVLRDELIAGADELGVLFVFPGGAYWYGSTLDLHTARALAPFNNATSLQVVAGVLGGIDWMLHNPDRGVVEAEALDHHAVLAVATPWLGKLGGTLCRWQPGAPGDLRFAAFDRSQHNPSPKEMFA